MNRIVNLTKRVKTAEGLRYCPVVEAANGRIKPDVDHGTAHHACMNELKRLYS